MNQIWAIAFPPDHLEEHLKFAGSLQAQPEHRVLCQSLALGISLCFRCFGNGHVHDGHGMSWQHVVLPVLSSCLWVCGRCFELLHPKPADEQHKGGMCHSAMSCYVYVLVATSARFCATLRINCSVLILRVWRRLLIKRKGEEAFQKINSQVYS